MSSPGTCEQVAGAGSLGNDLLSLAYWKHFLLTGYFPPAPSHPSRSSRVNTEGDFSRKPCFSYASRIEILSPCSFSELLLCPSGHCNLNFWPSSAKWRNHDFNLEPFKYIWGGNSLVWAYCCSYTGWTSVYLETAHLDHKSQDSACSENLDFTMGECWDLNQQPQKLLLKQRGLFFWFYSPTEMQKQFFPMFSFFLFLTATI